MKLDSIELSIVFLSSSYYNLWQKGWLDNQLLVQCYIHILM
jgi:hypothetical protein